MNTTFYTKLLKHPNYMDDLFENLQTFSFKETFADLRFVCANRQTVYAHKLLLCSVSKQMKKMISELPTGLDVVTIYIPDIDVNKLTIVIEFLYKGQIRLLSEDYKDFEEVMTILGIEFQFSKTVERQQLVAVLPGQPTGILPNTAPSVSHNSPILFTPHIGLPQNQDLSRQNLPTKTFLPASSQNSRLKIHILPIAHLFTNQTPEILINNYNENQNTFYQNNTTPPKVKNTSHNLKDDESPKAVVINAAQAYQFIKKNNEPSFLERIKHNPQVSLTNVSTKSVNSDSTSNTTPTNLNRTAQVCQNGYIEENRNLNNTNAQNFIVDVEEEEVQCISVNTNMSHTKIVDNAVYIDLAGIEDTTCNDLTKSVNRCNTNIIKDVSVNSMCIDLVDDETESEKSHTQVTSVNTNINLSTNNVKDNTNKNKKNLPKGNIRPDNQTLQNRMNEYFNALQKRTKIGGFYKEDNQAMNEGSTLMEQKNSKDGTASTSNRVEEKLTFSNGNDKTKDKSTLAEQTNLKNDSQSVTNIVDIKKTKRRKVSFKNDKVPDVNCQGRKNSLGVSSRGRKLKPSARYPELNFCEDEGAGKDETTQPNSTSDLTGNTQLEEILSTTITSGTRHQGRPKRSLV